MKVNGIKIRQNSQWRYVDIDRFNTWESPVRPKAGPTDYAINEDCVVCHLPTETFFAPSKNNPHFIRVFKERFITSWLLAMAFEIVKPWRTAHAVIADPSKPVHISNIRWVKGRKRIEAANN